MFHVEHSGPVARWILEGAADLELTLAEDTVSSLCTYLTELTRWNQKVNLTALRDDREIVVKHFLDSLFCFKVIQIQHDARVLDVGAGAGFPGLPLKIAARSIELTLLEPSQKKTAFLRHIIGILGLKGATVVSSRIDQLVDTQGSTSRPFTHVVCRALGLEEVSRFAESLLCPGGLLVLWQGPRMEASDRIGGLARKAEVRYELPFGCGARRLVVFSHG